MYHQLYMTGSCILEHRSNYSFDIIKSMGILARPYTCHTLFVSHRLVGTILIQKPKATMPQPRKHHLSIANPMISIGHMMRSCPHTSGGNMLTQKIPHSALHGLHHPSTPMHNPHFTLLDPHTLKKA